MKIQPNKRLFPIVIMLTALIIVSLACSKFTSTRAPIDKTATSEAENSQVDTDTPEAAQPTEELATPTEEPSPTSMDSPTPSSGQLTGTLVSLTSGNPVVGAGILLCKMTDDSCQITADLTTTTQAGGAFSFQNLDAGKYVILYDPDGPDQQAETLTLDLSDQAMQCAINGLMGSVPEDCKGKVPIFGSGNLSMLKDTKIQVSATGFKIEDGSLVSTQFGIHLDFANGNLITAEIQGGQTTNIVVKDWDK